MAKKDLLSEITAFMAALSGEVNGVAVSDVVDAVVRTVQGLGFRQVVLPPLEQKQVFTAAPAVQAHFGERLHEVAGPGGEQYVLPPTQLFNLYKLHLTEVRRKGAHVVKYFYLSPVARNGQERLSFDYELGMFVLGHSSSLSSFQVINAGRQVLIDLGIGEVMTEINSIGCAACQRQYQDVLSEFLSRDSGVGNKRLCASCLQDLSEERIVNLLSCRNQGCQQVLAAAPQIIDSLEDECRRHLVGLLETLDELDLPYVLSPSLVTSPLVERILFRLTLAEGAAAPVLAHGGEYSSAVAHLDQQAGSPVVGLTISLEDLLKHISSENLRPAERVEVFVISLGDQALKRSLRIYQALRQGGVRVAEAMLGNTGIRNQLREAKARDPQLALIIGQREALDDTVILRDMKSGMQELFPADRILEEVEKRLGR